MLLFLAAKEEGTAETCVRSLVPGVGDEPRKTSSLSAVPLGRVGVGGIRPSGSALRRLRRCGGVLNSFGVLVAGDDDRRLAIIENNSLRLLRSLPIAGDRFSFSRLMGFFCRCGSFSTGFSDGAARGDSFAAVTDGEFKLADGSIEAFKSVVSPGLGTDWGFRVFSRGLGVFRRFPT